MQYLQITNLDDWQTESVMVHIGGDQRALIRWRDAVTVPNKWFDPKDALQRAHGMLSNNPDYKDVVVYLEDGAVWNSDLGELVPSSSASAWPSFM